MSADDDAARALSPSLPAHLTPSDDSDSNSMQLDSDMDVHRDPDVDADGEVDGDAEPDDDDGDGDDDNDNNDEDEDDDDDAREPPPPYSNGASASYLSKHAVRALPIACRGMLTLILAAQVKDEDDSVRCVVLCASA